MQESLPEITESCEIRDITGNLGNYKKITGSFVITVEKLREITGYHSLGDLINYC